MAYRGRSSGLASIGVVLLVVLGIWLFNGAGPGTPTGQSGPSGSSPTYRVSPGEDPQSGLPLVALADLPPEAAVTVRRIDTGGPYPYDSDGATFANYEGLLPDRPHSYYQEFTVDTPGSPDRGARRIVRGQDGELYWSDDHYASFSRVQR